MSATSVTLRGRAAAEVRMLDTCTVTRTTGSTTDPETGQITATTSVIYAGKCRIRQPIVLDRPLSAGEAQRFIQHSILSVPVTAPVFATDDAVAVTASTLTAGLVGRKWRVRALGGDTNETAARYEIAEVTS